MSIFTAFYIPALIGALFWTLLQAIAYRSTKRSPSPIKWLILAVAGLLIGSFTIQIAQPFPALFSFIAGYVGADLINSIYIIFNNELMMQEKSISKKSR